MTRRPQLTITRLMLVVAALVVVLTVAAGMRRKRVVEALRDPVAVAGWTPSGLRLGDGRTVPLPGIRVLPASSSLLAEATSRGVEVGADGRVVGLLRVHHWCGNDPVREHVARVDLALLLEFLGEGQPAAPPIPGVASAARPGGRFSPYGWNISEYYEFRAWCELARDGRGVGWEKSIARRGAIMPPSLVSSGR